MIRTLLVLLFLAGPALAQPVRVYSGEHGDFTRLVVELPSDTEWTVGRTPEGYALAISGPTQPDYDLSSVWQRIARTRVAALEADASTGTLKVTLGCDCHLFPFEYQPGVVVLDIKPGPAPQGSAFEAAFKEQTPAALPSPGDETTSAYDWLSTPSASSIRRPVTILPLLLPTGEVSLEPIRDALLEQIARGAADGVVDMGLPLPGQSAPAVDVVALPWSDIRIGERPGILVSDPDAFAEGMLPAATCAADGELDLAAWGEAGSPIDLLSTARSGLYGEFDAPDSEAVLRSVRLHLYLGFGAEAGQQADLLDQESEDGPLALYRSMALLVDGESDPDTPFAAMLDCDGPAALWAALARDRLPAGPGVNRDAILRAFLALPAHLRRHLGSPLAEKFLARDDADAVRVIRDAIERAPDADPAAVALLDAESDLHLGDAEAARDHALEAVALDGNQAEALIALVETHFRQLEPIGSDVPDALLALRGETSGTALAGAVDRALVLSLGLSSQTEAAFLDPAVTGDTLVDLWRVVQDRASDDDFLRHAVLPSEAEPPDLEAELDLAIAKRLLALGFPDAALVWTGPVLPTDAPDLRLAAAEAELGRRDARRAVELLSGLPGTEAATLRENALLQLDDLAAAGTLLAAAGQTDAALRASLWQGDWSDLDPSAPEAWQTAAQLTKPALADASTGLLGRGADALAASSDSRAAIEALLGSVATPGGG
ncbi:MAG: hypothetical protein ACK47C_14680 [Paracoccaceae bacterium]